MKTDLLPNDETADVWQVTDPKRLPLPGQGAPRQIERAPSHGAHTTTSRELGADEIIKTIARLRDRIAERFPESSLGRIAGDLHALAQHTRGQLSFLREPHRGLRAAVAFAILAMLVVVIAAALSVRVNTRVSDISQFLQAIESGINDVVFLSVAIWFLVSLETRRKRARALELLHHLRSIAHIVDMHQLTKDPEYLMADRETTASSPIRSMTAPELGRYLDYCSEMLSLTSKVAVLIVQRFNDPLVLGAVNEVEALCSGLSGKIWQKITLLERVTSRHAQKHP